VFDCRIQEARLGPKLEGTPGAVQSSTNLFFRSMYLSRIQIIPQFLFWAWIVDRDYKHIWCLPQNVK